MRSRRAWALAALTSVALLASGCQEDTAARANDLRAVDQGALQAAPTTPVAVRRESLSLVSTNLWDGDRGLARDHEIRLTFDDALDQGRTAADGVTLIKVSTGEAVSVPTRISAEDPRTLVISPSGPQTLEAETEYDLLIGGGLFGGGPTSVRGRTLHEPERISFTTASVFEGFHALSVTPASGSSLWVSDRPTILEIRFSDAVATRDLPERLTNVLCRVGGAPGEGTVPVRLLAARPKDDGAVLRLTTLAPLAPGNYRVRITDFSAANLNLPMSPWPAMSVFTVKDRETFHLRPSPTFFTDALAPENVARRARVHGRGLHEGQFLNDGLTASQRGRAAWLDTVGRHEASEPKIIFEWDEPVMIAALFVDTDDARTGGHGRILSSYRVEIADGSGVFFDVAAQTGALGDHTLVLPTVVFTRSLALSYCRPKFEGVLGLANPLIYEIGICSDPGYTDTRGKLARELLDLDLGSEGLELGNLVCRDADGIAREPWELGVDVRVSLLAAGARGLEERVVGLPDISAGRWVRVQIEALPNAATGGELGSIELSARSPQR